MTIPNTPAFGSVAATITGTITVPWGSALTVSGVAGAGAAAISSEPAVLANIEVAAVAGAATVSVSERLIGEVTATLAAIAGAATTSVTTFGNPVDLTITRLDGGSGSVLVSNGIPLLPGAYTKAMADARKGKLTVGGSERQVYACGLGRHPDNSYRTLFLQFTANTDTETTATLDLATVRGGSDATYTTVAFIDGTTHLPPAAVMANPTAGWLPAACALPTDPTYLMASNIAGAGLVSNAAAEALSGTSAEGSKTMGQYADITDQRFDYWMVDYHINGLNGKAANTAFKDLDTTQYPTTDAWFGTTYPDGRPADWGGAEPPQYRAWRAAIGQPVSGHGHPDSYSAGLNFMQQWARTGDIDYWKVGCSLIGAQVYYTSWTFADAGANSILAPYSGGASIEYADPSGVSAYFLTTADPYGLQYLLNPDGSWGTGYGACRTSVNGLASCQDWQSYTSEARPVGRAIQATHEAWKATRAEAENNPLCDEQLFGAPAGGGNYTPNGDYADALDDLVAVVLSGTARRTDGVWTQSYTGWNEGAANIDACAYCNTFMQAIMLETLIRLYEDGPSGLANRTSIVAEVKKTCDTIWTSYWAKAVPGGYNKSFANAFGGQSDPDPATWSEGVPMNGMYAAAYAWLYYKGQGAGYQAKAHDIIAEAVGEGTVSTDVDGTVGPYPSSVKQCHEHFCYLLPGFGWLVKAGG